MAAARIGWLLLLLIPAATSASARHDWDIAPGLLLLVSAWWIVALRLLMPGPAFFWVTWPVAFVGVASLSADLLRNVDLLELAAQWRTLSQQDVLSATSPYLGQGVVGAFLLLAWAWICTRGPVALRLPNRLPLYAAVCGTLGLAIAAPSIAWTRAWPASAAVVAGSIAIGEPRWTALAVAGSGDDPGRPQDDWSATREAAVNDPETYVLVIGDSLRADAMRECGAPAPMRNVAAGSIVACDMTAGSNATHTSVPLLIGRSEPGLRTRIPADSTFLKGFEQVGFHTAWFSTQGLSVAWPDALEQQASIAPDHEFLLPALERAVARHPAKLAVVLHATGAHEPYCSRFDRSRAPFGDACARIGGAPTAETLPAWRAMYANAADASVGFVNEVIARLERAPGRVFLVFTSDHGENLMDDARGLHGHALRTPTPWDLRVPATFWANEAWRRAHPERWERLKRQAARPLMHADIVPTLLQAAEIRYREPRTGAIGLLDTEWRPRERRVQVAVGSAKRFEDVVADVRPLTAPQEVASVGR